MSIVQYGKSPTSFFHYVEMKGIAHRSDVSLVFQASLSVEDIGGDLQAFLESLRTEHLEIRFRDVCIEPNVFAPYTVIVVSVNKPNQPATSTRFFAVNVAIARTGRLLALIQELPSSSPDDFESHVQARSFLNMVDIVGFPASECLWCKKRLTCHHNFPNQGTHAHAVCSVSCFVAADRQGLIDESLPFMRSESPLTNTKAHQGMYLKLKNIPRTVFENLEDVTPMYRELARQYTTRIARENWTSDLSISAIYCRGLNDVGEIVFVPLLLDNWTTLDGTDYSALWVRMKNGGFHLLPVPSGGVDRYLTYAIENGELLPCPHATHIMLEALQFRCALCSNCSKLCSARDFFCGPCWGMCNLKVVYCSKRCQVLDYSAHRARCAMRPI